VVLVVADPAVSTTYLDLLIVSLDGVYLIKSGD
jgi:hypothetical protein